MIPLLAEIADKMDIGSEWLLGGALAVVAVVLSRASRWSYFVLCPVALYWAWFILSEYAYDDAWRGLVRHEMGDGYIVESIIAGMLPILLLIGAFVYDLQTRFKHTLHRMGDLN